MFSRRSGCYWKENHIIYFAAWRGREHVRMPSGQTRSRISAGLHSLPQPITHHEIWMDSLTVLAALVITTFQQSRHKHRNSILMWVCIINPNLISVLLYFFQPRTTFAYFYSMARKVSSHSLFTSSEASSSHFVLKPILMVLVVAVQWHEFRVCFSLPCIAILNLQSHLQVKGFAQPAPRSPPHPGWGYLAHRLTHSHIDHFSKMLLS